jgi:hypothetical protein
MRMIPKYSCIWETKSIEKNFSRGNRLLCDIWDTIECIIHSDTMGMDSVGHICIISEKNLDS